jgi:uncharacterized membrane protein
VRRRFARLKIPPSIALDRRLLHPFVTVAGSRRWTVEKERSMKLILIAGFLLGLPAVIVILANWNNAMAVPALASLFIAALPFVAFAVLWRRARAGGGLDEE